MTLSSVAQKHRGHRGKIPVFKLPWSLTGGGGSDKHTRGVMWAIPEAGSEHSSERSRGKLVLSNKGKLQSFLPCCGVWGMMEATLQGFGLYCLLNIRHCVRYFTHVLFSL